MMSGNEDSELQELVKETLEKTGCLAKIRAELRAKIFLALEENGRLENTKVVNNNLKSFASKPEGILMINLLKDFLDCFGLSFTASVFDPELESYGITCRKLSRNELIEQLGMTLVSDIGSKSPLINEVLLKATKSCVNHNELDHNKESNSMVFDDSFSGHVAQNFVTSNLNKTYTSREDPESAYFNFKREQTRSSIPNKDRFELSKSSLSSLAELPPLSSPLTDKNGSNSNNVTPKQFMKLKAMFLNPSSEALSNDEICCSDNDESTDLDNFNEDNVLKSMD